MIRWELLDTAPVPDGGQLCLMRRGTEYSIMADGGIELMNSRLSGSEEALATLTAERLRDRPAPRVLIGGLGMGFTLRAALAAYGPKAELVVAEIVPAVIDWARGPLSGVFQRCLDDSRTTVRLGDVAALIAEGGWDAILLDVDNGPGGLTRAENDGLYSPAGLARAKAALTPGGVLAVWSSVQDHGFTRRLKQAGFAAGEVGVRAHRGRGARHVIWIAARA
jgi:spermidine synthase